MEKFTLLVSIVIFCSVEISVDAKIKSYKNYKAPAFSDAQSNDDETDESKYFVDNEFPILPGELDLYDPKAPGGLLSQSRPRQTTPSSSPTRKPSAKPTKPSRRPSRRPKPTGRGSKPNKACDPSKPHRCKVKIVKTENVKIAAPRVTDQGVFPTDAKRSEGTFVNIRGHQIDPVDPNSRFYVFGDVNRKGVKKEDTVFHMEHDSYAFNHDAKVTGLTVEISVTLYTASSLQFDVFSNGTKRLTFRTGKDDITELELKWYG